MSMSVKNIYEAAFLKTRGFKLGRVSGFKDIEVLGDDSQIQKVLKEYYSGASTNAYFLLRECEYVRYLAKKAQNLV